MKITLTHPSGVKKKVKVGFSWTLLFFGLWVPVFRADWNSLLRMWLLGMCTLGIYVIVACWTYNKRYGQWLMEQGYQPSDSDRQYLV